MEGEASILATGGASLSSECVLLSSQGGSAKKITGLEDRCCISEDKVDCSIDCAVLVELSVGEGVKGVLVALKRAPPECTEVTLDLESYGLVVDCPCCVADGEVPCDKIRSLCGYISNNQT